MLKVRGELGVYKAQNEEYRQKIEELMKQRQNLNSSQIQYGGGRPSTSHAPLSGSIVSSGGDDSQKVRELNNLVQQLQSKVKEQQSDLQREQSEKKKFKDLSEKYQNQLAQA